MWLHQTLPLNFSELISAFSKYRQRIIRQYCVVSRSASSAAVIKDTTYERCVKKAIIAVFEKSRLKNKLGVNLFACCGKKYSSDKKKVVADMAKFQVMKYQTASMSADELKSHQNSTNRVKSCFLPIQETKININFNEWLPSTFSTLFIYTEKERVAT